MPDVAHGAVRTPPPRFSMVANSKVVSHLVDDLVP